MSVTLLVALAVMFVYPLRHDTGVFWSPYYKVSTQAVDDGRGGTAWSVSVNGIPHQRLTSAATREAEEPYYLQPYRPARTLRSGCSSSAPVPAPTWPSR